MQSVFIENLYDEAMDLMENARDYILYWERRDREVLSLHSRLTTAGESLRMTARLTSVMAWVLTQKAVHNGEIGAESMVEDENRLLVTSLHLEPLPAFEEDIPPKLRPILERSESLFQRVRHLDQLAAIQ